MYKISELYDLDHTLAKDYLAKFEYPWQALSGIKDLILELCGSQRTRMGTQECQCL